MAWNYLRAMTRDEAIPLIRAGIQRYNEANRSLVRHGYNETITMFYVDLIEQALQQATSEENDFEQFLARCKHLQDPLYIFEFYSKDILNSDAAKHTYLKPDKTNSTLLRRSSFRNKSPGHLL